MNDHIRRVIAVFMIALQSVLALVASLAMFASAHRIGRWAFGATIAYRHAELGLAMLVVAAVACVIALFLAFDMSWARVAAIVFEALAVLGALARIGAHPVSSIVAIAFAVAIILLTSGSGAEPEQTEGATSGHAGAPV